MGRKSRSVMLELVVLVVVVLSTVCELKEFAPQLVAALPPTSPNVQSGTPIAASHTDKKYSLRRIDRGKPIRGSLQGAAIRTLFSLPPAPASRFPVQPPNIQSSLLGVVPSASQPAKGPAISPINRVNNRESNHTSIGAPLQGSSFHSQKKGFSPSIVPAPATMNDFTNTSQGSLVSPQHMQSSPKMSIAPHEAKPPSYTTHAPLSSGLPPTPHELDPPLNTTYSPPPSDPLPFVSSPVASPSQDQIKEPSKATVSPPISPSLPLEFSPETSPAPHDLPGPSNTSHSPLSVPSISSGSSPAAGFRAPGGKKPTNVTHSPIPSRTLPLESPAISPVPPGGKRPSYVSHAPLSSNPDQSLISPMISPTPNEGAISSNITHSPFPSRPIPSESSPTISPAPHEVKGPVNTTHPPLASDPPLVNITKPPAMSPVTGPTPHEMRPPLNITHSPLPSHATSPESSPFAAPHEGNNSPNIRHAPTASPPKPSGLSPRISPVPHEPKESANGTLSPLPSLPFPSQTSPATSPTPHDGKGPSNITHSPPPADDHPSGFSPAVSPLPHGGNNQSNTSPVANPAPHRGNNHSKVVLAPLASPHPSESSPLLSPLPYAETNLSNISPVPMPHHPHPPSEARFQTPALPPSVSVPPSQSSSHNPGPTIPSVPSHNPVVSPSNELRAHSPSPDIHGTAISPVQAPSHPPASVPITNQRNHASSPYFQAPVFSPLQVPVPSSIEVTHAPSPSLVNPSHHSQRPIHPPVLAPEFSRKPTAPPPRPVWAFPPPPPNMDCKFLLCQDPVTYPPPGSLCVCVLPIKVGLRLGIELYTFFPLVSELAQEIASGAFVKESQVRVMGANAASGDAEKTVVLVDVVPLGRSFDMNTALLIYERFWHKQISINTSYFGNYDVLYVDYPGLPPSPPMALGDGDGGAITTENARTMQPLGVDVGKKKEKLSGSLIAIIVLSSVIALVFCIGAASLLLVKCRNANNISGQPPLSSQQPLHPFVKPGGALVSGPSSTSASCTSSVPPTGSAKCFSLAEIERATDRFNDSKVIGEGGFGRVYQGVFDDGTMAALKVLKRDDHQGGREFLAEVEMLSRLHHRNLVKLIGICTEENVRCLVYELIPNGSVESHLHGLDKETSPLDWNERLKIALGAARGLAYLHEDSSPRVIHRDFKSSNILLERDFTPKVSDFGLARIALDEGNNPISTQVMGTFGYVAPEYAMTGHLLVKSDVYSYGVVLLELLTGRKPVDMSQPPGQENLVNWARPLLTSMDGLEKMIDSSLATSVPLDTIAKVAAIASMCVQPEVTHRPSMGEVVQALKLVCNECDEHRRSCSPDESSTKDSYIKIDTALDYERMMSESDILDARDASGPFRRYTSSGPLRASRSQRIWDRVRGFSSGSIIGNGTVLRTGPDLENGQHWP